MIFSRHLIQASCVGILTMVPMLAHAEEDTGTKVRSATQDAMTDAYSLIDKRSEVVRFKEGQSDLSTTDEMGIKALVDANSGKIDTVILASWSDKDYETKAFNEKDRDLAEKRSKAVERCFNKVGVKNVRIYNMATTPNWFQKTFSMDEAEIKTAVAKKQLPVTEGDRNVAALARAFSEKGGAGKVVAVLQSEADTAAH